MLAAVIANVNRSARTKAFKPEDFMPAPAGSAGLEGAAAAEFLKQEAERMRASDLG